MKTELRYNDEQSVSYPNAWKECKPTGKWKIETCGDSSSMYLEVSTYRGTYTRYKYKSVARRRFLPYLYLKTTVDEDVIGSEYYTQWVHNYWVHEDDLRLVTISTNTCGEA